MEHINGRAQTTIAVGGEEKTQPLLLAAHSQHGAGGGELQVLRGEEGSRCGCHWGCWCKKVNDAGGGGGGAVVWEKRSNGKRDSFCEVRPCEL